MENEIALVGEVGNRPLTAMAVVSRVRLIQEVMAKVMKKDTHYGTIPGCAKPSLWKPGAEQLLVTFRIAPDQPKVDDLSTQDCIRYRVTRSGLSNGSIVAAGVGECSSDEEKYKWRSPICDAEFEAAPEDRKRLKFKRDGSTYKQIRTNPADIANTILKMADKRAFVAMTLLATAASDIFTQDLEDLPAEIAESIEGGHSTPTPIQPARPKEAPKAELVGDAIYEFVPTVLNAKPGSKGDKSWVSYSVKLPNGDWASTFDENHGAVLSEAKANGRTVRAVLVKKGAYLNIGMVAFLEEANS